MAGFREGDTYRYEMHSIHRRKGGTFLALIFVLGAMFPLARPSLGEADLDPFHRGLRAWREGRREDAIQAWEELLILSAETLDAKRRAVVAHNLGVAHLDLGHADQAIPWLEKAEAWKPGIGKARKLLLKARFELQMASLRKVQRLKAIPSRKEASHAFHGPKPPGPPDLMAPVEAPSSGQAEAAPQTLAAKRSKKESSRPRLKGWKTRSLGSVRSSSSRSSRSGGTSSSGRPTIAPVLGSPPDAVTGASR